jgi:hypothetical protein
MSVRIGLVASRGPLPAWQADVIERVTASGAATIAVFFESAARPAQKSRLHRWYERADRRLTHIADDPNAPIDVPALARVPRVPIDLASIDPTAQGLDVVLVLADDERTAQRLARRARHGAWMWVAGGTSPNDAPFLRELRERRPTTGVSIVQVTDAPEPRELDRIEVATEPGLSQMRNSVQPLWALAERLVGLIEALSRGAGGAGGVRSWDARSPGDLASQDLTPPGPPGPPVSFVTWLGPEILRKSVRRLTRSPKAVHWQVALRRGPHSLLHSTVGSERAPSFSALEAPPGRFYADPFLFAEAGTEWLFIEDYDRARGLGRLACAPVNGLDIGDVQPVLEQPYHLSYPCLIREAGEIFLLPETASNGTVDLYRCERFPDRWAHVRTLLNRRAVDTTPLRHDGRWWFFTTLLASHGGSGELWLFSSPSIDGDWQAHPASPISTDVRTCRNAGAIVCDRGRRFRPSQDSSGGYGARFTLQEIVELDARTYRERAHVTFEPDRARGEIGAHTYARLGDLEAIDVCTMRRLRDLGG